MIELSLALVAVALIVRDCFRHWVKHVDLKTFQGKQIELLRESITQLQDKQDAQDGEQRAFNKLIAEDWKKKFEALERSINDARKHVDTQLAGNLAQLPATGRGFGR